MLYELDPLTDPRWTEFLERHPSASVFHSPDWLRSLNHTYGYEPIAFTTSPPGSELANGIAFCRVRSRLTGRRMVSLPFSDHAEPLVEGAGDLEYLLENLHHDLQKLGWRYTEIRPRSPSLVSQSGFEKCARFYIHRIDLRPPIETLFRTFHKSCTQRKIRRAEREALTYEEGRSSRLLSHFYRLLILTCRRKRLPPQPMSWFHNVIDCMGDKLKIRVAYKNGVPVASIVTLAFKNSLVFKYGSSDTHWNNLGGTHLLFWKSIQEAKSCGIQEYDLGRSDCDNSGLISFKDRWGTTRSLLTYLRSSASPFPSVISGWTLQAARKVFSCMPDRCLIAVGERFYRHIG